MPYPAGQQESRALDQARWRGENIVLAPERVCRNEVGTHHDSGACLTPV